MKPSRLDKLMMPITEFFYLLCIACTLVVIGLAIENIFRVGISWQWPATIGLYFGNLWIWKVIRDAAKFCMSDS